MDTGQETLKIEFQNTGLNIRVDPKRLPSGTFQFLQNVISEQEGSITTRRGRKKVGTEPGSLPHTYAKMVVADTEVPFVPSTNYRYIGDGGDIYRTQDFSSFTNVAGDGKGNAAAVCTTPVNGTTLSPRWSAATFNVGTLATPVEFFATQNYMLKDSSKNPVGAHGLQTWGILPAFGVATGVSVQVTAATNATPIVITTNIPHGLADGNLVGIAGVLGNTASNSSSSSNIFGGLPFWYAKVTGFTSTTFAIYSDSGLTTGVAGNGSYTSGGYVANFTATLSPGTQYADGGASGSTAGTLPYSYVYTYANSKTLSESNPSQEMSTQSLATFGTPVNVFFNYIAVGGIYGTDDIQVDLIYLYRAGGSLTDGIYRRIQVFGNPGLGNLVSPTGAYSVTISGVQYYLDVAPDDIIVDQPQLNFDNDPPVPSTAKVPLRSTMNSVGPIGPGRVIVNFNDAIFAFGGAYGATQGSMMHILGGEDAIIEQINSATQVIMYLQQVYSNGQTVEIDTISGQPCTLCCTAYDSVFLAGDPNNPHILYKSKTGSPESFPVADASGNVLQVNVSNPGNPIVNITEFRGNILCMCDQGFYEVPIFNGVMLSPNQTPSMRGLMFKDAWCRVDNEIWYLGYDGIWSWDGSNSVKRSEAVDPVFHTLAISLSTVNQMYPLDYTPTVVQFCYMAYNRGKVYLVYTDTNANTFQLVYEVMSQRWFQFLKNDTAGVEDTVIFTEIDTGNLIYMRGGGVICIDDAENATTNATTDEYTGTAGTNGSTISARATTGWMDFGDQFSQKVIDEVMLDVDLNGATGTAVTVQAYSDYQFGAPYRTYSLANNASGRQWISLIQDPQTDPGTGRSGGFGQPLQVLALSILMNGGPQRPVVYGLRITYRPVGAITAGPVYDWNDLGYLWDKRLTEFTVTYDTNTIAQTLVMDTISGINGNTVNLDVSNFSIITVSTSGFGPGRAMQAFSIPDSTIVKMVRLRALATNSSPIGSTFFRILNTDFQFNKFPPDTLKFTEPNDFGYPYEKVARNLNLTIDTGGVAATVSLLADDVVAGTYTVSTGLDDWRRVIPVNTSEGTIGKMFKLRLAPGSTNGKAQLFDWNMDFLKLPPPIPFAEPNAFDYPYEKVARNLVVDMYTGGNPASLYLLGDGVVMTSVTMNTSTIDDRVRTFPVAPVENQIAKLFQLQLSQGSTARLYNWNVDFLKIPPPIPFGEPSDFGYPCEKVARNVTLDMYTGGQLVTVSLLGDNTLLGTFSVQTSSINDRIRIFPVNTNPDQIARLFQVELVQGSAARLYNWNVDYVKEPCAVSKVDTFETDFGFNGWKYIYQGWFDYQANSPLTVNILRDSSILFYSTTLPAHASRDMERFYLPFVVGSTLNKSKKYRVQVFGSGSNLKLYSNSKLEWMPWNGDQRSNFNQFNVSPEQPLPVG